MLSPHGSSEDDFSNEDEFEAMLYSKIHYTTNTDEEISFLDQTAEKVFSDSPGCLDSGLETSKCGSKLSSIQLNNSNVISNSVELGNNNTDHDASTSSSDFDIGIIAAVNSNVPSTQSVISMDIDDTTSVSSDDVKILDIIKNVSPCKRKFNDEQKYKERRLKAFFKDSYSDDSNCSFDVEHSDLNLNISGNTCNRENENCILKAFSCSYPIPHDLEYQVVYRSWTPEMCHYYNKVDVNVANENLDQILSNISNDDSAQWKIDFCDQFPQKSSSGRYFESGMHHRISSRCFKCKKVGHVTRDCSEPLVCYMCGHAGHNSDYCQNAVCLACGFPSSSYKSSDCSRCKVLRGTYCVLCGGLRHEYNSCPDKWRRFHLTTTRTLGPYKPEKDTHKIPSEVWCPNCAHKGHYLNQCRAYNYSGYPFPVMLVVSYDVTHCAEQMKPIRSTITQQRAHRKELLNKMAISSSILENSKKKKNLSISKCKSKKRKKFLNVKYSDTVKLLKARLSNLDSKNSCQSNGGQLISCRNNKGITKRILKLIKSFETSN